MLARTATARSLLRLQPGAALRPPPMASFATHGPGSSSRRRRKPSNYGKKFRRHKGSGGGRQPNVAATSFANGMLTWLMVGALFLGLIPIQLALPLLVGCWGIIMAFNLITLPVEFDASRRAKVMLTEMGFTATATEDRGVSEVLNAAAWTYVAAFITSLAYFLYYLLPFLTGRSDD